MLNPNNKLYRWGPISACPLFLYYSIEPAFAPLKQLFGITYSESLIIFQQNKGEWLLDDKDLAVKGKFFVNSIILDPVGNQKYNQVWDDRTRDLIGKFSEINYTDLSSLSDKSLIAIFKKFSSAYFNWFMVTISLELASSNIEPLMGEKLKKYVGTDNDKEFQKIFSTLTAPKKLTFYRREQRDMLNILRLTKSRQLRALKQHQQRYHWILNSYAQGTPLPLSYFKNELDKFEKTDWESIIEEIETYTRNITAEKQKILKSMNPTAEDLLLFQNVEQLAESMDIRKEYNFLAEFYLEKFILEFSKRSDIPTDDLKYLLPLELIDTLDNPSIFKKIISQRKKCFIFVCTENIIEKYEGDSAVLIARRFDHINEINGSIIHGRVASIGDTYYFRGPAKVILTINDIHKLKEGDVLIAPMTSPDYIIGMKKAGAIITLKFANEVQHSQGII